MAKQFIHTIIVFLIFSILVSPISAISTQNLTIHFIDVGQGDSILVQAPNNHEMLIDAGPTEAGSKVSSYTRSLGINDLEIVTMTHPHDDHIGGMSQILNDITVDEIIENGDPYTTVTTKNLYNLINQKRIPVRIVKYGDYLNLDPSINISVLNPQNSFFSDVNENSIVLKITKGKVTFLLEGDAGNAAENYMMSHGAILNADILKVGHHGSSSATGTAFLAAVTPEVSVIEVGAGNSYGHPTAQTLNRLSQVGSKIYRTDINGNIVVTSDGNTYTVIPEYGTSPPAVPTTKPLTTLPTSVPTTVPTITPSMAPTSSGTGSLSVTSIPSGALVYVDGTFKGITPVTIQSISTGFHQIKVTRSGYKDYSTSVSVAGGKPLSISATLTAGSGSSVLPPVFPITIPTTTPTIKPTTAPTAPSGTGTGSLSVTSIPSGALVYVDGTFKGITPVTIQSSSTGVHQIKVTKSGYKDYSTSVYVTGEKPLSISATLTAGSGSSVLLTRLQPVGYGYLFLE
jgi:beta-lactamase superfamily II metal-dependent hydrolase